MTSAWPRIVVENWRRRKWLILLLVLLVISALGIVPWGYVRSDAIQGRIVDGETGQPIPHAYIVIDWPQLWSTAGGVAPIGDGIVKEIETMSDDQGKYHIPGWKLSKREIGEGGFTKDRVEMLIYAAGYWPRTLRNREEGGLGWGEAWKAEWDGEDIELEPMHWREWSREEWKKQIEKNEYLWSYGRIPSGAASHGERSEGW